MNITTILVPTDFSESSFHAVQHGLELARRFGAKLHVFHVIREMVFYMPAFGGYSPSREEYAARATAFLDSCVSESDRAQVRVSTEYQFGTPGELIVRKSEELGPTLIVMGTHDAGVIERSLSEGVSQYVVSHAACPVLTVH